MAQVKNPKAAASSLWKEYGPWLIIIFFVYVLLSFRKVFSTLGDTVGDKIEAATAQAKADAQTKTDRAKVQQSAATKINFTDAQLATFRADANTLAGHFKTLSSLPYLERQLSFVNDAAAFSLLKQRYPRLRLLNNKPVVLVKRNANGTIEVKGVNAETPACIKQDYNWRVLIPAYKDATDGRNLESDIRATLSAAKYQPILNWIL